jgi:hypothetical protein
MMAEDGVTDYALAKRKASRQLGVEDTRCLPSNAEIEQELRTYQDIYLGDEQPEQLRQLRTDALATMQLLKQFNPRLTGAVLDGTAGRHAEIDIYLFADSEKDVEIFLLNSKIPYQIRERGHYLNGERHKVPVFALEGPHGAVLLSVFSPAEMHRNFVNNEAFAGAMEVEARINQMTI